MNVLVVASRFPWPPYSGDRLRTSVWIEALSRHAAVTLVAPEGRPPTTVPPFRFVPAARSPASLALALPRAIRAGLPATSLLAAGFDWRGALARAERSGGPFDAAVVVLARTDPWVFRRLTAPRLTLDAIDSLAENLRERARAAHGPARLLWRWEAARTARLERSVGERYTSVVIVNEAEAGYFGPRARVASHGIEIRPLAEGERDVDVAFWGRLAYFANRDAARVLLERIWPLVRRELPAATLLLGGADASGFVRRAHGRDGVTVASPIGDRAAVLRRVEIALVPLRYGSGQSNKVVEAAEAGCAVVSTPIGVRGLAPLAPHALLAEGPEALAAAVVGLLRERARARALGRAAREVVEREYGRQDACAGLAKIVLGPDA